MTMGETWWVLGMLGACFRCSCRALVWQARVHVLRPHPVAAGAAGAPALQRARWACQLTQLAPCPLPAVV